MRIAGHLEQAPVLVVQSKGMLFRTLMLAFRLRAKVLKIWRPIPAHLTNGSARRLSANNKEDV